MEKLAEYLRRSEVARLAETFRERFLDGDGEADVDRAAGRPRCRRPPAGHARARLTGRAGAAHRAGPVAHIRTTSPRADVTLLAGDAGSGKTWLAENWARRGRPARCEGPESGQAEHPLRLASLRVHKLLGGAGAAPEAVASAGGS